MHPITHYIAAVITKIVMLITVPFASVIIPLFTRTMPLQALYTWGSLWGTFDNPPQGDRGWITKHSTFPNVTTGWKGYINRVGWMLRNPLYGLAKKLGIDYEPTDVLSIKGNPDISDKYGIPGWMHASLRDEFGKLKGFSWYSVTPWSKGRCLRVRLGWKIKTDKMQERGWARMVFTCNPFDGYDNS
jgi:hypothetical protein